MSIDKHDVIKTYFRIYIYIHIRGRRDWFGNGFAIMHADVSS